MGRNALCQQSQRSPCLPVGFVGRRRHLNSPGCIWPAGGGAEAGRWHGQQAARTSLQLLAGAGPLACCSFRVLAAGSRAVPCVEKSRAKSISCIFLDVFQSSLVAEQRPVAGRLPACPGELGQPVGVGWILPGTRARCGWLRAAGTRLPMGDDCRK